MTLQDSMLLQLFANTILALATASLVLRTAVTSSGGWDYFSVVYAFMVVVFVLLTLSLSFAK